MLTEGIFCNLKRGTQDMIKRPEYIGVRAFRPSDFVFGKECGDAIDILEKLNSDKQFSDINEIIELYNVHKIISFPEIKKEIKDKYASKNKLLKSVIAKFFNNISDDTIFTYYSNVTRFYLDDFWEIFEKCKCYEVISEEAFEKTISRFPTELYIVLHHKAVVRYYDKVLSQILRNSDQTADIIIDKFLVNQDLNNNYQPVYLPNSFKPEEFELILRTYVNSEQPNIGELEVLAKSQSTKECPISDKVRLQAKKRFEKMWSDRSSTGFNFNLAVEVQFGTNPNIVTEKLVEDDHCSVITYDINWLNQNLDYPTILNNFIYVFKFTDLCCRSTLPTNEARMGVFERIVGIRGKKEYKTSLASQCEEMKSYAILEGYLAILKKNSVIFENIIKWFFEDYLKSEFNAESFIFNIPTPDSTILEKCKMMTSEMDGVIKQFAMFVKDGEINRELFEISSKPIRIEEIPSFSRKKYAYANSEAINNEMKHLFSDQSPLAYSNKDQKQYISFYDLATKHKVKKEDFVPFAFQYLDWMKERGSIIFLDDGTIRFNSRRVRILRDLFYNRVICPFYYGHYGIGTQDIETLVKSGELRYGDTLFSEPEQEYLNYVLNKSQYSNGLDLRNKYIHSTYKLDERVQHRDYLQILKIIILLMIKINEEFCLRDYSVN